MMMTTYDRLRHSVAHELIEKYTFWPCWVRIFWSVCHSLLQKATTDAEHVEGRKGLDTKGNKVAIKWGRYPRLCLFLVCDPLPSQKSRSNLMMMTTYDRLLIEGLNLAYTLQRPSSSGALWRPRLQSNKATIKRLRHSANLMTMTT
jgi:hypothetical protein